MQVKFCLKERLAEHEISQGELSRRSGVSMSTVNRVATNSTTRVDLETLARLSAALGCEPGELLIRTQGEAAILDYTAADGTWIPKPLA